MATGRTLPTLLPDWGKAWTILSLFVFGWRSRPRLSRQDLLQRVPCPCLSWFWRDRAGQFIPTDYLQGQAEPFPFSSCPLGLDFHHTLDAGNVMTKAAPRQLFRTFDQPSLHRIAMDVAFEVIVTRLPEWTARGELVKLVGNDLLKHLNRHRQAGAFRLADQ